MDLGARGFVVFNVGCCTQRARCVVSGTSTRTIRRTLRDEQLHARAIADQPRYVPGAACAKPIIYLALQRSCPRRFATRLMAPPIGLT